MKLRVFEIDAIASKVIETIKNSLIIPNFSKEINERTKLFQELQRLNEEEDRAIKLRKEFQEKHSFGYYYNNNNYTPEKYKQELESKYINSKLPERKDIENAVVLSGNKDLNELVEELIKKYS